MSGSDMLPDKTEQAVLEVQMLENCTGLVDGVDSEIETPRREGFPIYVSENGRVTDLQQFEPGI